MRPETGCRQRQMRRSIASTSRSKRAENPAALEHSEQRRAQSAAWFAVGGVSLRRCRCSPTVCAERRLSQTLEPVPCSSRQSPRAVRRGKKAPWRTRLHLGRACPLSIVCQKNGRGLKMLNRRALLASSASAALLAASARQAAAQGSATDVKIGVIYPFTGSGAQVGVDARVALETAADVINERYEIDLPLAREAGLPRLGGAKIQLVYADHQADPQKG